MKLLQRWLHANLKAADGSKRSILPSAISRDLHQPPTSQPRGSFCGCKGQCRFPPGMRRPRRLGRLLRRDPGRSGCVRPRNSCCVWEVAAPTHRRPPFSGLKKPPLGTPREVHPESHTMRPIYQTGTFKDKRSLGHPNFLHGSIYRRQRSLSR